MKKIISVVCLILISISYPIRTLAATTLNASETHKNIVDYFPEGESIFVAATNSNSVDFDEAITTVIYKLNDASSEPQIITTVNSIATKVLKYNQEFVLLVENLDTADSGNDDDSDDVEPETIEPTISIIKVNANGDQTVIASDLVDVLDLEHDGSSYYLLKDKNKSEKAKIIKLNAQGQVESTLEIDKGEVSIISLASEKLYALKNIAKKNQSGKTQILALDKNNLQNSSVFLEKKFGSKKGSAILSLQTENNTVIYDLYKASFLRNFLNRFLKVVATGRGGEKLKRFVSKSKSSSSLILSDTVITDVSVGPTLPIFIRSDNNFIYYSYVDFTDGTAYVSRVPKTGDDLSSQTLFSIDTGFYAQGGLFNESLLVPFIDNKFFKISEDGSSIYYVTSNGLIGDTKSILIDDLQL